MSKLPETDTEVLRQQLLANPATKLVMRDIALAMVQANARYIDLTVGGADVAISMRIFITKAVSGATTVHVGRKPR